MAVKRGGLGRNLSALLQSTEAIVARERVVDAAQQEGLTLPISDLQPGKYQPRAVMSDASLSELAESIKKQGLLQPIVVRAIAPQRYEVVAGERRWRACKLAGMSKIPVIIKVIDDETAMAMALVENLQREALNTMDEARAMHRLANEFSLTHQEIANLLSKSRASVSNVLRLINLTPEVQALVEQNLLDMGHARCLLMLPQDKQAEIAIWVHQKRLSVRETEALVARINENATAPKSLYFPTPLFKDELRFLSDKLQTKVNIKPGKAGKGSLIIHYHDAERLKSMIDQISLHLERC